VGIDNVTIGTYGLGKLAPTAVPGLTSNKFEECSILPEPFLLAAQDAQLARNIESIDNCKRVSTSFVVQ
jgi:hypothetical protein